MLWKVKIIITQCLVSTENFLLEIMWYTADSQTISKTVLFSLLLTDIQDATKTNVFDKPVTVSQLGAGASDICTYQGHELKLIPCPSFFVLHQL